VMAQPQGTLLANGMRQDSFFSLKMKSFLQETQGDSYAGMKQQIIANEGQEYADRYAGVTSPSLSAMTRAPMQASRPPSTAPVSMMAPMAPPFDFGPSPAAARYARPGYPQTVGGSLNVPMGGGFDGVNRQAGVLAQAFPPRGGTMQLPVGQAFPPRGGTMQLPVGQAFPPRGGTMQAPVGGSYVGPYAQPAPMRSSYAAPAPPMCQHPPTTIYQPPPPPMYHQAPMPFARPASVSVPSIAFRGASVDIAPMQLPMRGRNVSYLPSPTSTHAPMMHAPMQAPVMTALQPQQPQQPLMGLPPRQYARTFSAFGNPDFPQQQPQVSAMSFAAAPPPYSQPQAAMSFAAAPPPYSQPQAAISATTIPMVQAWPNANAASQQAIGAPYRPQAYPPPPYMSSFR